MLNTHGKIGVHFKSCQETPRYWHVRISFLLLYVSSSYYIIKTSMGFEDSRIAFKPGLYLYRNVDAFIPSYRGLSKKSFVINESREPKHYFFLMENKRISSLQRKPHHFLRDSLSDPELWKTTKIFIESNFINATENTHVSDQKNGLKSNCNKSSEKHTRDLFASKIYEKKLDYVGAGLGDIMSSEEKYFVSRNRFTHNASRNDDEKSGIYLNKEKSNWNESFSSLEQIANQPTRSGLVTTVGGMLQSQFGSKIRNLSAMDRIALTANGNLQRIFSSYYDAPVHVHVVRCEPQGGGSEILERKHMIWERTVHLSVHDKVRNLLTFKRGAMPYRMMNTLTNFIQFFINTKIKHRFLA